MRGLWDGPVWREAVPLSLECFRPEGSSHRPRASCKLLYNEQNIFGIYRVADQYVRCVHAGFQEDVWKDSCVEFFVQPAPGRGYYNFEFNCGGALLASYVTDPARLNGGLKKFVPLVPEDDLQIQRYASLPRIVEPEIKEKIVWMLEFSIPVAVLEKYVDHAVIGTGKIWRANFYKCGNETSHPHWASWAPLPERNFHNPSSFGKIEFCG